MTLVDITVRMEISDFERDYLNRGSSAKETATQAAERFVRNYLYLDSGKGETVVGAVERPMELGHAA